MDWLLDNVINIYWNILFKIGNHMQDENLNELIDQYSTQSDVESAIYEKTAGETEEGESIGERIKHYPKVQRELDLHGKTGSEAKREIERFIQNAQNQRIRTIRIVTGKGLHSPKQQSVIPEITEQKLSELKKSEVILSFKWEKQKGSIIVLLT